MYLCKIHNVFYLTPDEMTLIWYDVTALWFTKIPYQAPKEALIQLPFGKNFN